MIILNILPHQLSGQTISCTTSDQSAVYITQSGITISSTSITKSGDLSSSSTEDSEFYGVNAAVLVQGGSLTMTGGSISTSAKGSNALVATNGGSVTITGTTITSTGSGSARGLHATYGGTITANSVKITTQSGSCATLATDRGEGTVSCTTLYFRNKRSRKSYNIFNRSNNFNRFYWNF